MLLILFFSIVAWAQTNTQDAYLRWTEHLTITEHPEPGYLYLSEIHSKIATHIKKNEQVVEPFRVGKTVENRTIWGFKINPKYSKHNSVFILGGIHPMEWVSVESATDLLIQLAQHPPKYTEVVIIPVLNIDRRLVVERDLSQQDRRYRRVNVGGEDLNRDYEIHRDATAVWRHFIPDRYTTSSSPLSQPESQAVDALFEQYRFDASVSIHSFGGYIYYPWAGRYHKAKDWQELDHLGVLMKDAQSGKHPYRVKQLSHWMFLFRAQGTELDHFYGKYGARSFLIESTRSGIVWWKRDDWKDPFRIYNPRNPSLDIQRCTESMSALIHHYDHLIDNPSWSCPCQEHLRD